jgi:hypothetical protein
LHHASARNVVERIFGIIKKRWQILNNAPEFNRDIQARILPALSALHNFIVVHDPFDMDTFEEVYSDPQPGCPTDFGSLATQVANRTEKTHAEKRRDEIAQKMWDDYQQVLLERGEEDLQLEELI